MAVDAPRRAQCARCLRPQRSCLCPLVCATANTVQVLLLQHPAEAGQAKGSARLLALSLQHCRLEVGDHFADEALQVWLHADGLRPALLYPAPPGRPAPGAVPAGDIDRLVVLDGTWRHAAQLLRAHPLLTALPRVTLPDDGQPPAYAALRRAHQPGQLSTLEATARALAVLEGDAARYQPLQAAFAAFVARSVGWRQTAGPPPITG